MKTDNVIEVKSKSLAIRVVKLCRHLQNEKVSVKYSDTYANERPSVKIRTGGRIAWRE